MGLILLEAFGALVLLLLIVWWTMFSGRVKGELPAPPDAEPARQPAAGTGAASTPPVDGDPR